MLPRDLDQLISDPKEALDVFDFESVAKRNLSPAHFGYMGFKEVTPSVPKKGTPRAVVSQSHS